MQKTRIAVPSMWPGGLDALRSDHFGTCNVFTIIDIEDNQIVNIMTAPNVEHREGGCLVPVNLLVEQKVNSIVVGGMGMRPLQGFRHAGIEVLLGEGPTVNEAVQKYLNGHLGYMTEKHICGGH